jgi:hypothetical protein
MARVAHAMIAIRHRNQIAAISQRKDRDRSLRSKLIDLSRAFCSELTPQFNPFL